MIEFETNGTSRSIQPGSIEELRREIDRAVPKGHGICVLRFDGREVGDSLLDEFAVGSIGRVEVRTRDLEELATESARDTAEWMQRISSALESVADDYRMGREAAAASQLVDVIDALQVLMPLLRGIRKNLPAARRDDAFDRTWAEAEDGLRESVTSLANDFEKGDPIQLADLTGHALPRRLGVFRELLLGLGA